MDKIYDTLSADDYATRLLNILRVGKPGLNNGVLIFLSMKERRVELKLAYGFEWLIDQQEAQKIVNNMTGYFAKGDFYGGVVFGIKRVIELTGGTSWLECNGEVYSNCISKIYIEKVISRESRYLLIYDGRHKKIKLWYTRFMGDLIKKLITTKDNLIFGSYLNESEADLLGIN